MSDLEAHLPATPAPHPPAHRDHEPLPEGDEEPPPLVHAMAIVRWVLIGLMAAAAVGTWIYWLRPVAAASGQYHCPMHPSVIRDRPGDCPICGMDLVRIEEADGGAERQPAAARVPDVIPVMISAERVRLAGLQTARVVRERTAPELRTVGFVVPSEKGLGRIHTRYAGWIEELFVTQTGQRVARGQVLATVYSTELYAAQQDFLNVLNWASVPGGGVGGAGGSSTEPGTQRGFPGPPAMGPAGRSPSGSHALRLVEDARRKLELLGVSREEIDEVARSGKPVRALKLRSTAGGYVTQKSAFRGLYVQPDTELFQIADLSTVWVLADVYEYEIARVRVGQVARLTVTGYPGETFTGKVQFISPTVSGESRTLRVRLEFKNPGLKLKPGLYGTVVLDLPAGEGLAIPAEAVVDTGEVTYVHVAKAGGQFEPRRVKLGARAENRVQVLEGLAAGEQVVTTGNFVLDAEARLRAAIEGSAKTAAAPAAAPVAPAAGHRHGN
ncbi:MAG: efflux RND transporter periplasmic adaptor subunit [Deltaproteobacteria bacterium]|nr:efflux RND transporter periplasmic adaptor subunit [Deltaproteobacteria bacterium]